MPNNYEVKESLRARHVRIQLSLRRGLVITIPKRFDRKKITDILTKRQFWIIKKWGEFQHVAQQEGLSRVMPDSLVLQATGETFRIRYHRDSIRDIHDIHLLGNEKQSVQDLQKWLQRKAKQVLPDWLREVSDDIGLPFEGVTIRNQKGRWGSCSGRKNISLNQKLLFLPPEYVEYIMVHELCHTVQMNHSRHFWQLVESHLPKARDYDRYIKRGAWQDYVPWWSEE